MLDRTLGPCMGQLPQLSGFLIDKGQRLGVTLPELGPREPSPREPDHRLGDIDPDGPPRARPRVQPKSRGRRRHRRRACQARRPPTASSSGSLRRLGRAGPVMVVFHGPGVPAGGLEGVEGIRVDHGQSLLADPQPRVVGQSVPPTSAPVKRGVRYASHQAQVRSHAPDPPAGPGPFNRVSSSTLPRGLDELLGGLRVKQFMSMTTSG